MDTIQLIGLIMIFFGFIYLILRGMGKISDNDSDIQIMGSRVKGNPGIIIVVLGILLVTLGSGLLTGLVIGNDTIQFNSPAPTPNDTSNPAPAPISTPVPVTTQTPIQTVKSTPTPTSGIYAYIAHLNSGKVSVIDTATNVVAATVDVGSKPIGVAVNPAGTRVYVGNSGNNTVSVIDTAKNTVI